MSRPAQSPLRTPVIGGGPAGLFYAVLAKQRFPEHEIVVHERNAPDATFGFGVVFSESTVGGIAAADPSLAAALAEHGVSWKDIELRHGGGTIRCGGNGFAAISRKTLLGLLRERALEVGAEIRYESPVDPESVGDHDLLIAADGVNSRLREADVDAYQPRWSNGRARYIWFATPQPFDALTMVFVEDEHGWWGAHAYPFEDGTSTFIVETDEETWRRAGMDARPELRHGETDSESQAACEAIFAEHLGGMGLIGNNSRWQRFRTLRCERWHDGKTVLLGDAVHTAHFSVGSGTKMAMEDSVSLVEAIAAAEDLPAALASYQEAARPSVERIQSAAVPSLFWWERFGNLGALPIEQFGVHFLSRSPVVTLERLRLRDRRFTRAAESWATTSLGVAPDATPLSAALDLGGLRLQSRLVLAPPVGADALVALGGPALLGAGAVVGRGAGQWTEIVAWLHRHTQAAAAFALADGSLDAAGAADAGFDLLIAAAGAEPSGWPEDKPLLASVHAPAEPDSAAGDELLALLDGLASRRAVVARVTAAEGGLTEQLMLCDRIRQELGLPTVLVDPPSHDEAGTAIVAGRATLVEGLPTLLGGGWRQR